jgi:regulator of cell morphogenesis and NO signaling
MVTFDKISTIGDIVAARPSLSRVMDRHGISYCCGGGKSLELACAEKGLSVDSVLAEITQAMAGPPEKNLAALSLGELVEHVVAQHHCFLRETLPVVSRQLDRVVTVHGARHPELAKAQLVFHHFATDMTQHMDKEEQVLFPLISSLDGSQEHPMAANLEQIITVMESEHDDSGRDLTEMRKLLHDYTPPEGACGTYKAVLRGLADIEEDTQRHIHAENSVMFPKAIRHVAARA